jgi:carboxyl-terminal processing protease
VLGEFGIFGVNAGSEQDGAYNEMRVYAEVLRKIQTDYVTTPNIQDVTNGALHGLLDSLDPDSSYLTPSEYKIYKEKPASGDAQVGLTISKRYGNATVVSVLPGSPAAKAHLDDGDVIESINDQPTLGLSLALARLMLEGKPGTTVELSVFKPFRNGPDKITLTRTVTPQPPIMELEYENSTILYIKPGDLTAARVDDIAAILKADGKGRKILLDLRDSTGDDPALGVRLANFFIKQGTLATVEGQKYPKQTFTAEPAQWITDAPLAVLVNGGTYGPAEITAAAIEADKRGDVVGQRTFGEDSVQKTIELPDGAALLLTVAKYESPDGKIIQDDAVTPTVAVDQQNEEDAFETPISKTDDILDRGIELLKAKTS